MTFPYSIEYLRRHVSASSGSDIMQAFMDQTRQKVGALQARLEAAVQISVPNVVSEILEASGTLELMKFQLTEARSFYQNVSHYKTAFDTHISNIDRVLAEHKGAIITIRRIYGG